MCLCIVQLHNCRIVHIHFVPSKYIIFFFFFWFSESTDKYGPNIDGTAYRTKLVFFFSVAERIFQMDFVWFHSIRSPKIHGVFFCFFAYENNERRDIPRCLSSGVHANNTAGKSINTYIYNLLLTRESTCRKER